MTKEELEKFDEVIKIMDNWCPNYYSLTGLDYCYLGDNPDCLKCWKHAIESKLKEIGGN